MKQIVLIVIVMILGRNVASSSEFEHFTISLGYMGLNDDNSLRGGRISLDIPIDYIDFNVASVATQYDGTKYRISSNGIISLVGGLGFYLGSDFKDSSKTALLNPIGTVLKIPIALLMLTNPTVKTVILKDKLEVIYSIKTDYYFMYEVSRIYCEGVIGLRGRIGKIGLEANLGIPFTKGYFKDKTPYFGARVFCFI